jgi:hypothetical protein
MLDNTRFMHGRNAIVDAEERVILTNFGFLNFAKPRRRRPNRSALAQQDPERLLPEIDRATLSNLRKPLPRIRRAKNLLNDWRRS